MINYRYAVFTDSYKRAEFEILEDACLFAKALFDKYYMEHTFNVTIKRIPDELECEEEVE